MSQFKYVRDPYGYAYEGLTETLRATINTQEDGEWHRAVKAMAAFHGRSMCSLTIAERKKYLKAVGKEAADKRQLKRGACVLSFTQVLLSIGEAK